MSELVRHTYPNGSSELVDSDTICDCGKYLKMEGSSEIFNSNSTCMACRKVDKPNFKQEKKIKKSK